MAQKKIFGDYYMGLDMGTDSVGWAATDMEYKLLKLNGKAMWGFRLFQEAQTAVDRRTSRIARRRIQRRSQRLALLQDLFKDEVCAVDPSFFVRLSESMLHEEDKTVRGRNALFGDAAFDDKAYHKLYPTIYHLRSELIHSDKPHDVRLVYLAIHHIIKYRGHFLFEGSVDTANSFDLIMRDFGADVQNCLDVPFECSNTDEMKRLLCNRDMTRTDKQKKLFTLFSCKEYPVLRDLLKLITGAPVKLTALFDYAKDSEEEIKIEFGSDQYEQLTPRLEAMLGDDYIILLKAKAIHDWALLENTLHGCEYLSDAKKELYDRHAADLKLLKSLVRRFVPDQYDNVFKNPDSDRNYCAYSGTAKLKGKKVPIKKRCTQEDFNKYIESLFSKVKEPDLELEAMRARLAARTFMPKLRAKDNSVVPNQLHTKELQRILENASRYLPFLLNKDQDGISVSEKIMQILTFRIPYYVGPLNDRDPKAANTWVARRSHDKIYPWNFDQIVDRELSASRFITRMTAQCTYLKDQPVLPQSSLLYARFMVLNELNNLKLNGEPITVELKQDIYRDCFERTAKVTLSGLLKYLKSKGIDLKPDQVTGIDNGFKSSLRVYGEMRALLGDDYREDIAEEIIRLSTILGDDRKMFLSKLRQEYGAVLPADTIEKASRKRFTGWGRLSAAFLTQIRDSRCDPKTGEYRNIINSLWETNENLMQLLGGEHGFAEAVAKHNSGLNQELGLHYATVRDLYVSPSVKRTIWQTMQIVREVRKITGHDPKKVFIEMARGGGEKGKRTESRKSKLYQLYKKCKDDTRDWLSEIDAKDEGDFRSDRLYLYYTQMGRCMYTGEAIDLDKLFDKNVYDIDHIYPRSKVKDDSLDNRVLVTRRANLEKGDSYPIVQDFRQRMHAYWSMLLQKDLISKSKYERLVRATELTTDELTDFIARQLVETRQSTKAVADILKQLMPDTEIVYVKAGLVSEFRQERDLLKCREVNDMHHGKDAYLNIVVGNVYNTKFTKDPRNFFKETEHKYSLNRMYDYVVKRGSTVAWVPGESGTIVTVRDMMRRNNVLVTRMVLDQSGQLFDLQPVRKQQWQLPLKKSPACLADPAKYGGYNSIKGAYFMLVEHTEKKVRKRSLIEMPLHLSGLDPRSEACLDMLRRDKGLTDPVILIPHIGINSILEIDGCRMHLSGRTGGNRLIYCLAHQLIIGYENEKYLRNVLKFCDRNSEYAKTHNHEELTATEIHDGITKAKNLALYDLFHSKLGTNTYQTCLSAQYTNLEKARQSFIELNATNQCTALKQALNLLAANKLKADLSIIGLGSSIGTILTSRCMSNYQSVYLIDQSVTGLFETRRNLLP